MPQKNADSARCTDSINLEAQDQHPDKIVIPKKIEQHFITVLVGFWLSIFLGLPRINWCLALFPSQIVFSLISPLNSILMDTELCLDPLFPIFHGERRSSLEIPKQFWTCDWKLGE